MRMFAQTDIIVKSELDVYHPRPIKLFTQTDAVVQSDFDRFTAQHPQSMKTGAQTDMIT